MRNLKELKKAPDENSTQTAVFQSSELMDGHSSLGEVKAQRVLATKELVDAHT